VHLVKESHQSSLLKLDYMREGILTDVMAHARLTLPNAQTSFNPKIPGVSAKADNASTSTSSEVVVHSKSKLQSNKWRKQHHIFRSHALRRREIASSPHVASVFAGNRKQVSYHRNCIL
jgi:hypothetical protein